MPYLFTFLPTKDTCNALQKKVHDKDTSVNQTLNGVDILEIVLRTDKDVIF